MNIHSKLNYRQTFEEMLCPLSPEAAPPVSRELLTPVVYSYETLDMAPRSIDDYIHLMGGGLVLPQCTFAFSFTPVSISYAVLLYVRMGSLRLRVNGKDVSVTPGHALLLLDKSLQRLQSEDPETEFYIYFIAGHDLSLFRHFLQEHTTPVAIRHYPMFTTGIDRISGLSSALDQRSILYGHRMLTMVLSHAAEQHAAVQDENNINTPSYIRDMHDFICQHSDESFSLLHFEESTGISRFRLCREYGKIYGISPLQDFNRVRIEHAKSLLLNTSLSVHEICRRVGFENTTHFIGLFSKATGLTPGKFRNESRESRF